MRDSHPIDITLISTEKTREIVKKVVCSLGYKEQFAPGWIHSTLMYQIEEPGYCDFLKAFIDKTRPDMSGKAESFLLESFLENGVPFTLSKSGNPKKLVRNWLAEKSVSRETFFLTAYGTEMYASEVDLFLKAALRDNGLDLCNHKEAIHWFCFKRGLKYNDAMRLMARYDASPAGVPVYSTEQAFRAAVIKARTENALLDLLLTIKDHPITYTNYIAYGEFVELYQYNRKLAAMNRNREIDTNTGCVTTSKTKLSKISSSVIEELTCSGTPIVNGNVAKLSDSSLKFLDIKRLTRNRISTILSGKAKVDRTDLIIFNFLKMCHVCRNMPNYKSAPLFVESTNKILEKCNMGTMSYRNMYDIFLELCMLSNDPDIVYGDVWELSYNYTEEA
ncbi:MAG: hypothetical protein LBT59_08375 [Clostridiales bacterium]|jgi:hypothetical protein|nr:hypothetical protein [Clostridiales bacterium]